MIEISSLKMGTKPFGQKLSFCGYDFSLSLKFYTIKFHLIMKYFAQVQYHSYLVESLRGLED